MLSIMPINTRNPFMSEKLDDRGIPVSDIFGRKLTDNERLYEEVAALLRKINPMTEKSKKLIDEIRTSLNKFWVDTHTAGVRS